jgi:hypothetical protein
MTLAAEDLAEETEVGQLEDDLTSSREVAPKASKPEAKEYKCPHCDTVYGKGLDRIRRTNLSNHIRHKHKDAAPPKAKGVAKLPKAAAAAKAVPVPDKKRVSAADNIALVWEGGAQLANGMGQGPLAQSLKFTAPAGGLAVDQAIAGSFVDRKFVQPLSQGAEKWEAVGAVVSLNLFVFLASNYPMMAPALAGPARRAVEEVMVRSVPYLRKKVEKDRKLAEALEELKLLDPNNFGTSEDPVGDILAGFFAGYQAPVAEEEQMAQSA